MARVLAAMSGGVDSSVAAAILVDHGHDVTGVHLRLADVPGAQQVPGQGCCTLDDVQDARRVAQVLDIPFYVWDLREVFHDRVQAPFERAYAAGRTPNPCVTCNERVKYAALLDRALRLGFDALATGHHVRLRRGATGVADPDRLQPVTEPGPGVRMFRAADTRKDQTYVLYMADADQLAASLFPAGEMTKDEIRAEAERRGLRVAAKPDSYDICFVPDGDIVGYLAQRLPAVTGDIVDVDGTKLGEHDGVWGFTIGQRRGLGLGDHRRRFVVHLDATSNRVVVGSRDALACRRIDLDPARWIAGRVPHGPVRVQLRAHGHTVPATVAPRPGAVRVDLDEPLHGVAVGQALVVYGPDDRECLGGGRIVAADRPALPAGAAT